RSSPRLELEGFNVDPDMTRDMWKEALHHIVSAWTEEYYQADGKFWQMGAPRRVQPKPLQQPHPPIFGATSAVQPKAVAAAAPTDLRRHEQPRRTQGSRSSGHRALLVHRRPPARGA